jgi:hypothetical protein
MRQIFLLAGSLGTLTGAGCWLAHEPSGGRPPEADGDADSDADSDADADVDADVDVDADGDADGDPPSGSDPFRPAQVCGMRRLSRVAGGTLRVMGMDDGSCLWLDGCTVEVSGGNVDLRPTMFTRRFGDDDGGGVCETGPVWVDCWVPEGA